MNPVRYKLSGDAFLDFNQNGQRDWFEFYIDEDNDGNYTTGYMAGDLQVSWTSWAMISFIFTLKQNEDLNGNGVLDAADIDLNANGRLDCAMAPIYDAITGGGGGIPGANTLRPAGTTIYQGTNITTGNLIFFYCHQENGSFTVADNVDNSTPATWTSSGDFWAMGMYRSA